MLIRCQLTGEGTMPTDLEPVYRRLKSILEPYGRRLHVTDESPTSYSVDVAPDGVRNPTTWFGGVRLGKRYVSYYLMPVYVDPSLAGTISPELRRRMQGKSCFNFTQGRRGSLRRARFADQGWLRTDRGRPDVGRGETGRARDGPPSGRIDARVGALT